MKKNIIILKKELEILRKLNSYSINLQNASIFSILQFKYRIRKQKKIEKQITKLELIKQKVIKKYDEKINGWLHNPKINCRQYCKLEPAAIYQKEKILYKLGYISKKPISPTKQYLKNTFNPIINFFKSIISEIPFYKLNPKRQFTNIAINSTKHCIKTYRKLKNIRFSAKKSVLESTLMKKITEIKQEALRQLDYENLQYDLKDNSNSDFFDSIRVDVVPVIRKTKENSSIAKQTSFTEEHSL